MGLHFNFSKVHDHQRVTTDPVNPDNWHPVADALVWLSVICGFREITEKNADKVATRIVQYQVARNESYLRRNQGDDKPWQEVFITPTDVRRFIGMTTNASVMSDAQWQRHLGKIVADTAKYHRANNAPSALSIHGEFTGVKVDMHEAPTQPAAA